MEDIFDDLRKREEGNFLGLREVLGPAYAIAPELINLYTVLLEASIKSVCDLDDNTYQIPALMHTLQWMKNEAICGILMLMRGHISDASNFNRRALELCAFVSLMYKDKDSAERWMKAGVSKSAQEKYRSRFDAFKVVKAELPKPLIDIYAENCLNVHPSPFAVVKRASLDPDRTHRFSFFDLDEDDDRQPSFVLNFFNIILLHVKIMEFLSQLFYPGGHFDSELWMANFKPFLETAESQRIDFIPLIEDYMKKLDDGVDQASES